MVKKGWIIERINEYIYIYIYIYIYMKIVHFYRTDILFRISSTTCDLSRKHSIGHLKLEVYFSKTEFQRHRKHVRKMTFRTA
jgi:hypothetical protein